VRAWLYLPTSIFLTVVHANTESMIPGMNNKKKTNDMKGNTIVLVIGGPGKMDLEIDVIKKNAITKKPINPAMVDKM